MRALRPILATLAALLVPGCGGEGEETQPVPTATGPTEARRLKPDELDLVFRAEGVIAEYCRGFAASATGAKPPSARKETRAFRSIDRLLDLARKRPDEVVETGVDLGLYLSDLAENLEGSNCDPRLVGRLGQGRATLP